MITTGLTQKDSQPIFNKIQKKVQSWAAKKLSYEGRIQLIKSILARIHAFWSSAFILPKSVVTRIKKPWPLFYGQETLEVDTMPRSIGMR